MTIQDPIDTLKGVGPATLQLLHTLNIHTIGDALYHIPFRYDDFRAQKTIAQVEDGDEITLSATLKSITKIALKRGMTLIKAVIEDSSGTLPVTWFNQPYLLMTLRKTKEYLFSGKVKTYKGKKTLTTPTIEQVTDRAAIHSGRLVPIYPATDGITTRSLRTLVWNSLHENISIPETLPEKILKTYALQKNTDAFLHIHFPENEQQVKDARRRFAFEEVYTLLQEALKRKHALQLKKVPHQLVIDATCVHAFSSAIPFTLTPSQLQAIQDIQQDIQHTYPANRLIQGEVGSGKTFVAAFALYCASQNKTQSVFLAPTQVLAEQHFLSLQPLFKKLHVTSQFVTSDTEIDTSKPSDVFIGTHALFEHIKTIHPSVVVIDEEHRFGVHQRESFWSNTKKPHLITMTATPIPRTVAHTVLADRDMSRLEEIPSKKKDITTKVVPESKRNDAYEWIDKRIAQGTQIFVVCPLIEVSESETLASVSSAKQEFLRIQQAFPSHRVKLLHGKTPKEDRSTILESMRKGSTDILVATPVIEVGIDIPNASIMVIEGAERFGLAQLHQLRGRVGRAGQKAYCFLFPTQDTGITDRLKIIQQYSDGNTLAEYDLKLRGTGDILGTEQHGWDALRFASWFDEKLIAACKEAVLLRVSEKH